MNTKEQLLTAKQVAEMFQVHLNTLRNWEKNKKLIPVRVMVNGRKKYRQEDVERLLRK